MIALALGTASSMNEVIVASSKLPALKQQIWLWSARTPRVISSWALVVASFCPTSYVSSEGRFQGHLSIRNYSFASEDAFRTGFQCFKQREYWFLFKDFLEFQ